MYVTPSEWYINASRKLTEYINEQHYSSLPTLREESCFLHMVNCIYSSVLTLPHKKQMLLILAADYTRYLDKQQADRSQDVIDSSDQAAIMHVASINRMIAAIIEDVDRYHRGAIDALLCRVTFCSTDMPPDDMDKLDGFMLAIASILYNTTLPAQRILDTLNMVVDNFYGADPTHQHGKAAKTLIAKIAQVYQRDILAIRLLDTVSIQLGNFDCDYLIEYFMLNTGKTVSIVHEVLTTLTPAWSTHPIHEYELLVESIINKLTQKEGE